MLKHSRKVQIFLLLIIFPFKIFAHSEDSDSLLFKRSEISFRNFFFGKDTIYRKGSPSYVSNFSFQVMGGGAKYFFDNKTKHYFQNYLSNTAGIYIYDNHNLLIGYSLNIAIISIIDSLNFEGSTTNKDEKIDILNSSLIFGYNYEIKNNLNINPYIGFLFTRISKTFEYSKSYSKNGFTFGLAINKYFKLHPYGYLYIYCNSNFNISNYSKINSNLGNNFSTIGFGVGYKFWFFKKIR